MDDESLRLNISFVLREPSDSRTVHRGARESARFSRRQPRLLHQFSKLPDDELLQRVLIHPSLDTTHLRGREIDGIVTASVGLRELLPRTLTLLNFIMSHLRETDPLVVDQDVPYTDLQSVMFFNAPAMLHLPSPFQVDSRLLVAVLVVRPGGHELMLTGRVIELSTNHSGSLHPLIAGAIEDLVRDFVDQWVPARALWDAPVETLIPESRSRTTGAGGN